jgi:hypothetical protein
MQKLLLTTVSAIALGVCATAAMASGSATYSTQEGNSQSATIDQSLATSGKVGTAAVPFYQNNGAYTGGNVIAISQTGANDTFGVNAPSFQSGGLNQASVGQAGTANDVVLQQTGYNNGNAYDTISQAGTGNAVALEQSGTQNNFYIVQDANSSASDFTAFQSGNYNLVSSYQTNNVFASINQVGNNNSFYNSQNGPWDTFTSNTTGALTNTNFVGQELNAAYAALQFGSYNLITNYQIGWGATVLLGGQIGNNNNIFNTQDGSGSVAVLTVQNGSFLTITNNQTGIWNLLNVNYQYGANSSITNVQSGSGPQNNPLNTVFNFTWNNLATVNQDAYGSSINNTQTGSNGNATFTQFGSNNSATLVQGNTNNTATLYQDGIYNVMSMNQSGSGTGTNGGNVGELIQTGGSSWNTAYLTQSGDGNNAISTQSGFYSLASLVQSGDGNTIVGVQNGTGPYENQAYVGQSSTGNTASYSQNGSGNFVSIKQ